MILIDCRRQPAAVWAAFSAVSRWQQRLNIKTKAPHEAYANHCFMTMCTRCKYISSGCHKMDEKHLSYTANKNLTLTWLTVLLHAAVCCLVPVKLSYSSSCLIALNVPIYYFFFPKELLPKFVNFFHSAIFSWGRIWKEKAMDCHNSIWLPPHFL